MAKRAGRRNGNIPRSTCESLNLFKFPRTRHLVDAGGNAVTRDDLLMTRKEAKEFLKGKIISVEEKIDGANIGFSLDEHYTIRAQNRSHFVSSQSHRQFSTLDNWISQNGKSLLQILSDGKYILYGEWMYAKHSIFYTKLPNYFIAFDIYDSISQSFVSRRERDAMLQGTGISSVPLVVEREFQEPEEVGLQQNLITLVPNPICQCAEKSAPFSKPCSRHGISLGVWRQGVARGMMGLSPHFMCRPHFLFGNTVPMFLFGFGNICPS